MHHQFIDLILGNCDSIRAASQPQLVLCKSTLESRGVWLRRASRKSSLCTRQTKGDRERSIRRQAKATNIAICTAGCMCYNGDTQPPECNKLPISAWCMQKSLKLQFQQGADYLLWSLQASSTLPPGHRSHHRPYRTPTKSDRREKMLNIPAYTAIIQRNLPIIMR